MKVTPEKAENIKKLCINLGRKLHPTIRQVAGVVETLVATLPGVEHGDLHYRLIDIDKIAALKGAAGNYDAKMLLGRSAKTELTWWGNCIENAQRPVRVAHPSIILQSDASNIGWGGLVAHCEQSRTGGQWSPQESVLHINNKELLAALFTLQSLCANVTNQNVQLQIDNTTAIAYINKQGGRKPLCNSLARKIWFWAIARSVRVSATFIPGVSNVSADFESRRIHDNTEWKLQPSVFRKLTSLWGTPDIDLFASWLTCQIPCYASWKPDPGASAIDAFSISWAGKLCYIFPPFSLMGRVLRKIVDDDAEAIILAPLWTTQYWFSMLLSLLIDCIFLILGTSWYTTPPTKSPPRTSNSWHAGCQAETLNC